MALRYFKEKLPSLHVIAAGSLLEFVLHEERFSFPVGRIQFLYLKPLSFHEFLISQQRDQLAEFLNTVTTKDGIDPFIHDELLKLVRQYFLIGGMPAVVQNFREKHSFLECQIILSNLLETYRSDFHKYATKTQYKILQTCFEKTPGLICQHFKYSHINSEIRSQDLKNPLTQLGWSGLLNKIHATSASGIPLSPHIKENKFKLLFLDIGLVNSATHLDLQTTWNTELLQINAGIQAEQFVGEELLTYSDPHMNTHLFYWKREKTGSQAEIDYVIQAGSYIIPIEVKAGTTGTLKSMQQFLLEKKQPFGVRISQHQLSFHNNVLSVPLYLIGQLDRLIKEIMRPERLELSPSFPD